MDSVRALLSQYLRAAWRRRWMGVIVAWLVCGVGWVGGLHDSQPVRIRVRGCSSMPTPC